MNIPWLVCSIITQDHEGMYEIAQKDPEQESRVQLCICRSNKRAKGRENNLGLMKAINGGTIALVQERTGNPPAWTKEPSIQDLNDTCDTEAQRKGAISIGSIRDDSDLPLPRFSAKAPQ
jgi:hypothetical protein